MRIALVAHHESETNLRLVEAAPLGVQAEIVRPSRIRGWLGPGDAALARIDVLRSLDGMETGSWEVGLIENEGVRVLNPLSALMATHDKLQTAASARGRGPAASADDPLRGRRRRRDDRASGRAQASVRVAGAAT